MRPWRAVFACVLVSACGGQPTLPTAALLVEDTSIASAAVTADTLYWTASVGGESNHTGRVMRVARRAGATPETLATGQFNPVRLVVGTGGIYWSNDGDFVSCSRLRFLGDDGTSRDLDVGRSCKAAPMMVTSGTVTLAGVVDGGVAILELDEASGQVAETTALDGWPGVFAVAPPSVYLVTAGPGGGAIGRYDVGEGFVWPYTDGVREPLGLSVAGRDLVWVDGNYFGRPPEVYRMPIARNGPPTLVTEVEDGHAVMSPVYVGGALWLVDRSGTNEQPEAALLRIDLDDGSLERFPVDYLVDGILADGDGLVAAARYRLDGDHLVSASRIFAQPLP